MNVVENEVVFDSASRSPASSGGQWVVVVLMSVWLVGCTSRSVATKPAASKPNKPSGTRAGTNSQNNIPIADLCRRIEDSGGTIRYNDQHRPMEVDLMSGRASASAAALESVVALGDLRVLKVRVGQLDASQLIQIGSLKQLRELIVQDAVIDDSVLTSIYVGCPDLERLTLRNVSGVGRSGIAKLSSLPKLAQLALIEMPLPTDGLTIIAELPALVSLDVRMSHPIDAASLQALSETERLRELKLGGQHVDNAMLEVVTTIPGLERLTIEDAPIDGNGLSQLGRSNNVGVRLRSLTLTRCASLTDKSLENLASFHNLKQLVLRDVPVTGTFLKVIPTKSHLEFLALNQTFLVDEAFDDIAECQNLKRLELSQNALSPSAMKKIGRLTALEYLNLTDCALNDESLDSLSGLIHLKTLLIDGNPEVSAQKASALLATEQ